LSKHERNEIYVLLEKKYSQRSIAKALRRSVSTISDEIKNGSVDGVYDPKKADHKAYVRRKEAKFQGEKIVGNIALRESVETKLREGRSPESIAGRIKNHEPNLPSISADSIERFLRSVHGRQIEYERKQLKKAQKHKRRAKRQKLVKLSERKFIDERPADINNRLNVGDAEADFIVSGKDGYGILLTVADRKLRFVFIEQILDVTIDNVHLAFQRIHARYPELKSINTDNDILLRKHKDLEKLLGIPIYLCHPYHSWEKGTIENINGEIRKYIPKGSDISSYDQKYIEDVAKKINNRYIKLLRFATPEESLNAYRANPKSIKKRA
jgi:transposase, IS30 family